MVARYGGEEFVVVMPDTTASEALTVAERLRLEVAGLAFPVPGKDDELSMTVSIGAATSSYGFESAESLMERSDQALYGAKRAGRNSTVAAEPDRGQQRRAVAN
jgi:diguanylate cyclase (GGDEF)-like protein